MVISIGKIRLWLYRDRQNYSGKHIPRGCALSENAFAIEQAPPRRRNGGVKPQLTIQMFSAQEDTICEISALSAGFTSFTSARTPMSGVSCDMRRFRLWIRSSSRYAAPPRGVCRTAANSGPNRSTRASLTDTLLPHPPRSSDPSSASPS